MLMIDPGTTILAMQHCHCRAVPISEVLRFTLCDVLSVLNVLGMLQLRWIELSMRWLHMQIG